MTHWTYNDEVVIEAPSSAVGFCYIIKNNISGMLYIGRKYITTYRRKKVKTKSKSAKHAKKTQKVIQSSDWENYCGSNKNLIADIGKLGAEAFSFKIICWCYTKGQCNYIEEWLQYKTNALLDPRYYNNSIGSRRYIALSNNKTLQDAISVLDKIKLN